MHGDVQVRSKIYFTIISLTPDQQKAYNQIREHCMTSEPVITNIYNIVTITPDLDVFDITIQHADCGAATSYVRNLFSHSKVEYLHSDFDCNHSYHVEHTYQED